MASRKADYSPEAWERHKRRERERNASLTRAEREKKNAKLRRYVESKRRFLMGVKTTLGCVDCGTTEGRLDFDHRPNEHKAFVLAQPRVSWARLLAELEKCDVRCVACHARRHGIERGGLNGVAV